MIASESPTSEESNSSAACALGQLPHQVAMKSSAKTIRWTAYADPPENRNVTHKLMKTELANQGTVPSFEGV
jgi:hypothetical protein